MSGKRPSLAESLRQVVTGDPTAPPVPVTSSPVVSRPETGTREPIARPAGFYAATRVGKKKVTVALDPVMHKQLKGLALARDTTTEALLVEAINDLFHKHGIGR